MLTRRSALAAALGVAVSQDSGPASAQGAFADQPIKLVVPFAAGGPADIVARILAEALKEPLRQSVIVENRAGAGGVLGVDAVAKAAPNGAVIGVASTGALSVLPGLVPKFPYSVERDIQPVSTVVVVPQVLTVASSVPANTVAELVALAKAKPGTLNYGSSGNGTSPHLGMELFRARAGELGIVHVPYRGAAPALTDLMAGHVQVMMSDVPVMLPQIQAKTIRALGVTSAERSPLLPDVPTVAEAGVPGVISETYYGVIAPAGMPADKVATLHRAVLAAIETPTTRKRLEELGGRIVGNTPAQFRDYIASESVKWLDVIRHAGIRWE